MSRQPGVRRREWHSGTATWEARWYDASGKRHTANFDTAAKTEAYRQERPRAPRYGGTGDPRGGKITVAEWWQRWSAARQTA
jgi:hypothetical protein